PGLCALVFNVRTRICYDSFSSSAPYSLSSALSVGRWALTVGRFFFMPITPTVPDLHGHFGPYGGMFVPETLMSALHELAAEYERAKNDPTFQTELSSLLRDFAGRPTPLYFAERL